MSKFGYSKENPFHISVASLLTNDLGEICVHHFTKGQLPIEMENRNDLYMLMRGTLEDDETIEKGLAREMLEEYGAVGEIVRYVGSIQSHFPYQKQPGMIEKTTLYFHVKLVEIDETKREVGAVESQSELEWHLPEQLLTLLVEQERTGVRADVNDVKILKEFISRSGL